ncbi:MAG: gamma-glutamyltransferase [Planctomycetes bacterium]|nr:gamma-glutamyltransferase [Planctomycetota bacterium]
MVFAMKPLLLLLSLAQDPVLDRGVVVSPEPRAGEVGASMLARGGNAVDAAVATFFALAVTFPNAGNLGGGGFMLVRTAKGDEALDYRETAPDRAHRDLFLDKDGNVVPGLSLRTHLAAGVPGSVMGMWEAHRRHGTIPWKELLAPAIRLAEGYDLDEWTARSFSQGPSNANFRKYFHGKAGETFRQPELAATLRRIAEKGPDDFYRGETARLLVAEMKRGNGIITMGDLAAYRAVWRRPVAGTYRGHRIVSMPPPSSGGIAVIQILQMLEGFAVPKHNSPDYVHLLAEIEKRAFADRSHWLGDPDFAKVPEFLIDPKYAAARARGIALDRKTEPGAVSHGTEKDHTTHFSIVDKWGNGVANTTTLDDSYGSGIVVEGAGFLLNNEMDDFSAKPGVPNMFGVTGGEANSIRPGKRMLSSMSPTFVYRGDRLWLVLGSPGGPTIITTVAQVILNMIDHGMTIEAAVKAPRFHHQWPPVAKDADVVSAEQGIDAPAKWYVVRRRRLGDVQAIEIDGRRAIGAPDPRGIGRAIEEARMQEAPDFDALWNYDKPDETERKFREILATGKGDASYRAQLLTQIARCQGLQGKFDEAHKTLDEAEKLAPDSKVARIRCLLERGRAYNSAKKKEKARPLFVEALELARAAGEEFHAVDAAHMLGIVDPPKEALEWNLKAIAMAEASKGPRAKNWLGALYNNVGWTYHDLGEFEKALELFKKGLVWRQERNQPKETRIAKWTVGRALRSLKRLDEALQIQRELVEEWEKAGEKDGYVFEEMGECLLALGKADEAKPWFARAYEELSKDSWFVENEAERMKRLKELGGK